MILAARFGGTPWQWRGDPGPSPLDWGTAVRILEREAEDIERMETERDTNTGR